MCFSLLGVGVFLYFPSWSVFEASGVFIFSVLFRFWHEIRLLSGLGCVVAGESCRVVFFSVLVGYLHEILIFSDLAGVAARKLLCRKRRTAAIFSRQFCWLSILSRGCHVCDCFLLFFNPDYICGARSSLPQVLLKSDEWFHWPCVVNSSRHRN